MATLEWSWNSITIGQVRNGFLLVLDSGEVAYSQRPMLDGSTLTQVGDPTPVTVEFDAYTDGVARSTLRAALGVTATLTGPDSESFSNMMLVAVARQMVINHSGKRVTRLRWVEAS